MGTTIQFKRTKNYTYIHENALLMRDYMSILPTGKGKKKAINDRVKELRKTLKLTQKEFGVNKNWLRTGGEKMFLEREKKQREFFDVFDGLSLALQDYLIKTAKDLLETQSKIQALDEPK